MRNDRMVPAETDAYPLAPYACIAAELRATQEQVMHLRSELEERNTEIQLLHEIATALTAAASLEEMLVFIAATAVRVTETDSASIYALDETKRELIRRAAH